MDVSLPVRGCQMPMLTDIVKIRPTLWPWLTWVLYLYYPIKYSTHLVQVVFERLYPKDYTPAVATRVSNALLVGPCILYMSLPKHTFRLGAIIGQLFVGLVCDRIGRQAALVFTTLVIVLGATLGTAAHGAHASAAGLFWFLTFARGLTGIVCTGGHYDCVYDLIRFATRVLVVNTPRHLRVPARPLTSKCPLSVARVCFST